MRILHTSDWHLGRTLYGKKRYDEFEAFLEWLLKILKEEKIDALIVSGDIFDTSSPGIKAQELYYKFLSRLPQSGCRHAVIIAGNHDSPSFIDAPSRLLKSFNIHVIGNASESTEKQVITLYKGDIPEAVVCAAPYLRERELRKSEPGESWEKKSQNMVRGLIKHYETLCSKAEEVINNLKSDTIKNIPVIAMGHLFTAGGNFVEKDGVRDLYVGNIAHVSPDSFPDNIDYFALGHLHIPQIAGKEHIRYSGSPIPMGFGDCNNTKFVIIVDFKQKTPDIVLKKVPIFRKLEKISGNTEEIISRIRELKESQVECLVEIEYTDSTPPEEFRELAENAAKDSGVEILRIKSKYSWDKILMSVSAEESLEDVTPQEVFQRVLDINSVPEEEQKELEAMHLEILNLVLEEENYENT